MDPKDKWRLRSNRRNLIDIDAKSMCMSLIEAGVITPDDSERITAATTYQDKAEALLNMLETKGQAAYKEFVKALPDNQDYLVVCLQQTNMDKMPASLRGEPTQSAPFAEAAGGDTTDRGRGNIIITDYDDEVTKKTVFHDENYREECGRLGRGTKRKSGPTSIIVTGDNNVVMENSAVTITHNYGYRK